MKTLQGFVLSDQAIDPLSSTASCDGNQYLTQQIVPYLSVLNLILRHSMVKSFSRLPVLINEISWVLSSTLS